MSFVHSVERLFNKNTLANKISICLYARVFVCVYRYVYPYVIIIVTKKKLYIAVVFINLLVLCNLYVSVGIVSLEILNILWRLFYIVLQVYRVSRINWTHRLCQKWRYIVKIYILTFNITSIEAVYTDFNLEKIVEKYCLQKNVTSVLCLIKTFINIKLFHFR